MHGFGTCPAPRQALQVEGIRLWSLVGLSRSGLVGDGRKVDDLFSATYPRACLISPLTKSKRLPSFLSLLLRLWHVTKVLKGPRSYACDSEKANKTEKSVKSIVCLPAEWNEGLAVSNVPGPGL